MATIAAAANGNWNATATWAGGVIPGAGDIVYLNNFVVALTTSVTVQSIRSVANAASPVAVAGGYVNCNTAGVTLTITDGVGSADVGSSGGMIRPTHNAGTVTLTATNNGFQGGSSATWYAILSSGSGNLTINGNCLGGTNGRGVYLNSLGHNIINGSAIAGNALALYLNQGTALVTGDIVAGPGTVSSAMGCYTTSGTTLTVEGNLTPSSSAPAVELSQETSFLNVGKAGSTSIINNSPRAAIVQLRHWRPVLGANVIYRTPNPSGGSTDLFINGITYGDGAMLLSDLATTIGDMLEAALNG